MLPRNTCTVSHLRLCSDAALPKSRLRRGRRKRTLRPRSSSVRSSTLAAITFHLASTSERYPRNAGLAAVNASYDISGPFKAGKPLDNQVDHLLHLSPRTTSSRYPLRPYPVLCTSPVRVDRATALQGPSSSSSSSSSILPIAFSLPRLLDLSHSILPLLPSSLVPHLHPLPLYRYPTYPLPWPCHSFALILFSDFPSDVVQRKGKNVP